MTPQTQDLIGSGYLIFANGDRDMVIYRIVASYEAKQHSASAKGEIEGAPHTIRRAADEGGCELQIDFDLPPLGIKVTGVRGNMADINVVTRALCFSTNDSTVVWTVA